MFQEQKASPDGTKDKHEKPTQTEKKNLFALFFRVRSFAVGNTQKPIICANLKKSKNRKAVHHISEKTALK